MAPPERKDASNPARDLGSPYGPQPDGPDQVAGGADSSPHETKASNELHHNRKADEGIPGSQANQPGEAGA